MSSASRLGFTLIEVVVGVVLVGIGMTAALRGLGAMTHSDVVLRERESCQRLAVRKLDELLATGQVGTTPISGDFADWNDTAHAWNLEVIPSGVDNLYTLRLNVTDREDTKNAIARIETLRYSPPATGTSGGAG